MTINSTNSASNFFMPRLGDSLRIIVLGAGSGLVAGVATVAVVAGAVVVAKLLYSAPCMRSARNAAGQLLNNLMPRQAAEQAAQADAVAIILTGWINGGKPFGEEAIRKEIKDKFIKDGISKDSRGRLTVPGNLDLSVKEKEEGQSSQKHLSGLEKLTHLPNNLTVTGDLNLSKTSINPLPSSLWVHGNLDLRGCKALRELPGCLKVNGKVYLNQNQKIQIQPNQTALSLIYEPLKEQKQPPNA